MTRRIRYCEYEFEKDLVLRSDALSSVLQRTVRRLLAEGRAGSYEKAELAAQLLNFNFDESDSVQAAEECSSIYTAIQFLQQECELCAERYPMRKVCRGY